jgi:hypothetical protein
MQFGAEAQRRWSGRSFAPERRYWVSSTPFEVSAGIGHELSRTLSRGAGRVVHGRGSAAGLHPGIANTDRSRHIANISHI